jgi:hypothetical protein
MQLLLLAEQVAQAVVVVAVDLQPEALAVTAVSFFTTNS